MAEITGAGHDTIVQLAHESTHFYSPPRYCGTSPIRADQQMSSEHAVTETLDVKGENCPMPVVKTKQGIDALESDEVLEVVATDPGSISDLGGWAETTDGVELIDQEEDDAEGTYRHYVRKL